jgi:protein transport protein SEC23
MSSLEEAELRDGVRMPWNAWVSSRIEGNRMVIPISCMYTMLKKAENYPLPVLQYEPLICKPPCKAILNPFCTVDIRSRVWTCPFCFSRNQFPPHYQDITTTNLPAELLPHYTTLEYTLPPRGPLIPPVFVLVVDLCLDDEDLSALKDELVVSLTLMPPNALVGLITFGTMVFKSVLIIGNGS